MLSETPRTVHLPGQRLRRLAHQLLNAHPLHPSPISSTTTITTTTSSSIPKNRIRVICIADTHNHQPDLPPGDILLHAGDLTENGSFDEIQNQLTWLSSQPHQYKVIIAGNHDVLLDESFLEKYPERRYGETRTLRDLDWGSVRYLQDDSVTVDVTFDDRDGDDDDNHDGGDGDDGNQQQELPSKTTRSLTIYGNPWTPQYTLSAFQYPSDTDIWTDKIPSNTDIVLAHGPPRLHLDTSGPRHAGCPYLAREIFRVRPRLVVFGHIHVSYGRDDVVLDRVRQAHDEIVGRWGGWGTLLWMAVRVVMARVKGVLVGWEKMSEQEKVSTFVNAAVVREFGSRTLNAPVVVDV